MEKKKKIYYLDSRAHIGFQDQFLNLFPELRSPCNINKDEENDTVVKNITFVTNETCNLNCSYCVSGDTKITMSDFSKKKIKEIKIGDNILAFNEKDGNKIEVSIVEKIYYHKEKTIIIELENGEILNVTKNHKLLSEINSNNNTWKEAGDFAINQYLYYLNPSKKLIKYKIKNIKENNETIDVYNIGTSTKTYIANNILVHNCYEIHKANRYMTKEIAKKAIDAIFDKEKMNDYITDFNKCAIIEFIGGEPLLNIEVIEFICEYFLYKATILNHPWAINYMFNITTNGTLLDNDRIKRWIEKYKNRLSLGITIDGNKELHDSCRVFYDGSGSYDIVSKNVKYAIENYGMKSTKITFAPENIDKINESIPHLFNMGLTELNANCVFENVWKDEHVNPFYNELIKLADYIIDNDIYEYAFCSIFDDKIGIPMKNDDNRNFCGGTGSMLAIGTDGKFYPCIRYMQYALSKQKEKSIGNINTGIPLVKDQPFLQELKKITRRSQSTDECFNCKVARGCAWCSGFNYDEFGTADKRATYICKMHKARVLANYYYWNKLYQKLDMDDYFELNLNIDEINFITNNQPIKIFKRRGSKNE